MFATAKSGSAEGKARRTPSTTGSSELTQNNLGNRVEATSRDLSGGYRARTGRLPIETHPATDRYLAEQFDTRVGRVPGPGPGAGPVTVRSLPRRPADLHTVWTGLYLVT